MIAFFFLFLAGSISLQKWELERAHTPIPKFLRAPAKHLIPSMINKALLKSEKQSFQECQEFDVEDLNVLLTKAYGLGHEDLQELYLQKDDNRKLRLKPTE